MLVLLGNSGREFLGFLGCSSVFVFFCVFCAQVYILALLIKNLFGYVPNYSGKARLGWVASFLLLHLWFGLKDGSVE